jgi:hypothetical protein
MILALMTSEGGLVRGDRPKGAYTVTSKARYCINGSSTHGDITILHQRNDFMKHSRPDELGPGIV